MGKKLGLCSVLSPQECQFMNKIQLCGIRLYFSAHNLEEQADTNVTPNDFLFVLESTLHFYSHYSCYPGFPMHVHCFFMAHMMKCI